MSVKSLLINFLIVTGKFEEIKVQKIKLQQQFNRETWRNRQELFFWRNARQFTYSVSQTIDSIIADEYRVKNTIFSEQVACKGSLYKENCRCRIYSTIR